MNNLPALNFDNYKTVEELEKALVETEAKMADDSRNAKAHIEEAINLLIESAGMLKLSGLGTAKKLITSARAALNKADAFLPEV